MTEDEQAPACCRADLGAETSVQLDLRAWDAIGCQVVPAVGEGRLIAIRQQQRACPCLMKAGAHLHGSALSACTQQEGWCR